MNVLVCRTDKLGDILLSLPSLISFRSAFPEAGLYFLYPEPYRALLDPLLAGTAITSFHSEKEVISASIMFDFVFMLNYDSTLARSLRRNQIASIVGPATKLSSLLLFRYPVWQNRRKSKKSEAVYAFELLNSQFKNLRLIDSSTLPLSQAAQAEIKPYLRALDSKFIVVHPGMAGSARNLSVEHYLNILREIRSVWPELKIVLSVGPSPLDKKIATMLRAHQPNVELFECQPLTHLAALFKHSELVIAPSTGPLHLAHWVGTTSIGLYSPVLSHHPQRWAPFGGSGRSEIIMPQVDCPGRRDCLLTRCPSFDCFEFNWSGAVISVMRTLFQVGMPTKKS